jgi:hypothetical protein
MLHKKIYPFHKQFGRISQKNIIKSINPKPRWLFELLKLDFELILFTSLVYAITHHKKSNRQKGIVKKNSMIVIAYSVRVSSSSEKLVTEDVIPSGL